MNNFELFSFLSSSVFIAFVFIGLIIPAGLGAWLADKKGYSVIGWFFICLLTGIFGLIAK